MKVEIIQEKFAKALNHINKAISNRPNIPVLANVLIETEHGSLKLSSTNLEIGIIAKIGAEIIDEGKTTVSAKLLSEFINSLKPGKIQIELKDQMLSVQSVDNNADFCVISADEFPNVPSSEGKALLELNANEFARAVDKVTFAASTDNSRPVLTGVLTKITKRNMTLVGVDGFRLSQILTKIEDGPEEDFREIIPAKTMQEISKIIKDTATEKEKLEIYSLKKNNQVVYKIGNIELVSRLIEGDFPNYEDIIPKDKQFSFNVLKQDLANGVKIVSIFARNVIGNKTRFTIEPDENKLKLSAVVIDVGNNESSIDISTPVGEKLETSYNAKFMQDMINSIEGDEIIFETNGVTAPGVFKDKNNDAYLHIIMPMRLD
ncbi:DNA polymerase III subunit beta [Candidatus Dojkabacteria bacterium]|nr:DNA polymerase III subunit beta [Candidatus Dojkabacteria bacterium]